MVTQERSLLHQERWGLVQLRDRALSGLYKALGSIPSTTKREKRKVSHSESSTTAADV